MENLPYGAFAGVLGNLEEAINLFTEAVKLNPQMAALYAKRARFTLSLT